MTVAPPLQQLAPSVFDLTTGVRDHTLAALVRGMLPGTLIAEHGWLERKPFRGTSTYYDLSTIISVEVVPKKIGPLAFLPEIRILMKQGFSDNSTAPASEDVTALVSFLRVTQAERVVGAIQMARASRLKEMILAYENDIGNAYRAAYEGITRDPEQLSGQALLNWIRKVNGERSLSSIINNIEAIARSPGFAHDSETAKVEKRAKEALGDFRHAARERLRRLVKSYSAIFNPVAQLSAEMLPKPDRYIRGSVLNRWRTMAYKTPGLHAVFSDLEAILAAVFFEHDAETKEVQERADRLAPWLTSSTIRKAFNDQILQREAKAHLDLFRHVESKPLTEEQIRAALIFEDINLAVAAAGSGKSSVIVAKIGYALRSGLFTDDEIIALAFNTEAAEKLSERISEKLTKALGRPVNIQARTFHSLGNELLRLEQMERVKLVPLDGREGRRRFNAAFLRLLEADGTFSQSLFQFVTLARYPLPKIEKGTGSLEQNEWRYHKACREVVRKKRDGAFDRFEPQLPTIDRNLYVRSIEEASIANWLILRKVKFDYEKDAPDEVRKALWGNASKKSYIPDFSYPVIKDGKEVARVWHEHFGIGKNNKAPDFMGGDEYVERAKQKRKAFDKCERAARERGERLDFFETTSLAFRDGALFDELAKHLAEKGVEVGAVDKALFANSLAEFRDSGEAEKLFLDFVQGFRESGLTPERVREKASLSEEPFRANLFLDVALPLAAAVEEEYSGKFIEYCDMLKRGAQALLAHPEGKKFKLILVDEFQDTALLRYMLIKALAAIHPDDSVIFLVGDDWQAINRFAGSDLDIFKSFVPPSATAQGSARQPDHFGEIGERSIHMVRLTETFRSCQGIANVTRHLMKTLVPSQIDKEVQAKNKDTRGTVRIVQHEDNATARERAILNELTAISRFPLPVNDDGTTRKHDVFILNRYRKTELLPDGLTEEMPDGSLRLRVNDWIRQFAATIEIKQDTMHSSKGLETDFVIIPGMDAGYKGFPNDFGGDPIFELVLPRLDHPIDEEVRLLYVAMTRARKKAILLTAADRPSEFILLFDRMSRMREFADHFDWHRILASYTPCPTCKKGALQPVNKTDKVQCTRQPKCGHKANAKDHPTVGKRVRSRPAPKR